MICSYSLKVHDQWFKDEHILLDVGDVQEQGSRIVNERCKHHDTKKLTLACKKCNEIFCVHCSMDVGCGGVKGWGSFNSPFGGKSIFLYTHGFKELAGGGTHMAHHIFYFRSTCMTVASSFIVYKCFNFDKILPTDLLHIVPLDESKPQPHTVVPVEKLASEYCLMMVETMNALSDKISAIAKAEKQTWGKLASVENDVMDMNKRVDNFCEEQVGNSHKSRISNISL